MSGFCWQCGGKLEVRNGTPIFDLFTDAIGHAHKVHIVCGSRLQQQKKPITAQEREQCEYMMEWHERQEEIREIYKRGKP